MLSQRAACWYKAEGFRFSARHAANVDGPIWVPADLLSLAPFGSVIRP